MQPTPRGTLAQTGPLLATALLSACGGGGDGGGGGSPRSFGSLGRCLAGDWYLTVVEDSSPSACLAMGLENALVTFTEVPAGKGPATPDDLAVFTITSSDFDSPATSETNSSLSASYFTIEAPTPPPLLGIDGVYLAGYYYDSDLGLTLALTTGPSSDEFQRLEVDCDSFLTFVDYVAYPGFALVQTEPAPGVQSWGLDPNAVSICEGHIELAGDRSSTKLIAAEPATSGSGLAATLTYPATAEATGIQLLAGQASDPSGRGSLVSLDGATRLELVPSGTGGDVRAYLDSGEASGLGTLSFEGSVLRGTLLLQDQEGKQVLGHLSVERDAR